MFSWRVLSEVVDGCSKNLLYVLRIHRVYHRRTNEVLLERFAVLGKVLFEERHETSLQHGLLPEINKITPPEARFVRITRNVFAAMLRGNISSSLPPLQVPKEEPGASYAAHQRRQL